MNGHERVLACRRDFELRADALFEGTWASLRELALPFRFELDLLREPGGAWSDFFASAPLRALDLPILLLDDLGVRTGGAEERAEHALFESAALRASVVLLAELLVGAEAHYSFEHSLLLPGLVAAAEGALAEAAGAPGAAHAGDAGWDEMGAALVDLRRRRIGRSSRWSVQEMRHAGRRWAPLFAPIACAARRAGRDDVVPALRTLFDEAAALFQLGRDLASVNRDLARGHCTFPIARVWEAIGGTASEAGAPDPDRVLLGAALTRTLPDLAADAERRVAALLDDAGSLELPQVRAALAPLAHPFRAVSALYDGPPPEEPPGRASFFVSHRPQLRQVIDAAAGYLRSDPEYREAWEVHRWELLGVPDLTCRVFPTALLLEHRVASGDRGCGAEIDALFARYAAIRFHYFEQPSALPPDGDTLGVMLRLAAHAGDPGAARALLETPLAWLPANVDAMGEIPVFLTRGVEGGEGRGYAPALGRRCAAAQGGLLLGLLALDARRFGDVVARAARSLFGWFARAGGGAFRWYDAPYGAGVVLALIDAAVDTGVLPAADEAIAGAGRRAVELVRASGALGRASPQHAALLWLATRSRCAREARDPAWVEVLLRTQRHDGSWDAAPLYAVPTRGNAATWHSSRMVTAALGLNALCDFAAGSSA